MAEMHTALQARGEGTKLRFTPVQEHLLNRRTARPATGSVPSPAYPAAPSRRSTKYAGQRGLSPETFIALLQDGRRCESLRAICRDPGMPSEGTVRGWAVRDHDGFGERDRAARSLLVESWADQILDIADEPISIRATAKSESTRNNGDVESYLVDGATSGSSAATKNIRCSCPRRSFGRYSDQRPN